MKNWTKYIVNFLSAGTMFVAAACAEDTLEASKPSSETGGFVPQTLEITLSPQGEGEAVTWLGVALDIPVPDVKAGEALLRMPVTLVGTPTAQYTADDITVSDEQGALQLSAVDDEPTPEGVYRRYLVSRDTVGDVAVSYGTAPRAVDATTRNGPLFDLRAQGNGLMGAGVYFYALPVKDQPYKLDLTWDMSEAPEGSRGIWSFGEGSQSTVAPANVLAFSYYATGPVLSEPPQADTDFALYWLDEPKFDIKALAAELTTLYGYMSEFFNDKGAPYRVFMRQNPYPAGGGTGLAQSFMFGVANEENSKGETPSLLLAHEIVHNWPRLNGSEPHALTAWYTEGNAEYYSSALSYRAGLIGLEKFLDVVNERAKSYYANPHINLTNAEAGKIFWSDSRAQRVPYGRGFMYLVNLNAALKKASGGERSLDDLVLEVRAKQVAGETVGIDAWKAILERELGADAVTTFDDMVAGKLIVPSEDSLAPCFRVKTLDEKPFELGYDRMTLTVVQKLVEGSEAAKAGLQEGDKILSFTPLSELREDPEKKMDITVNRDGEELSFSYLPRRDAVNAWIWERVEEVPNSACNL